MAEVTAKSLAMPGKAQVGEMPPVIENVSRQWLSVAILDGGLQFEMAEVGGSANWIANC